MPSASGGAATRIARMMPAATFGNWRSSTTAPRALSTRMNASTSAAPSSRYTQRRYVDVRTRLVTARPAYDAQRRSDDVDRPPGPGAGSPAGRADPRTSPSVTPSSCQIPPPATSLARGSAGKPLHPAAERGLGHPEPGVYANLTGYGRVRSRSTSRSAVQTGTVCGRGGCRSGHGQVWGTAPGRVAGRLGEDPGRWTSSHREVPAGRLTTLPDLMFDQISDERGRYEVEAFRHRPGDGPGARPGQCV